MAARFHPAASRELIAAAERYEEATEGLGIAFLAAVRRALDMLSENPDAGEIIVARPRRPIRKWVLRRFPFTLVYVAGDAVRILAVANVRRKPMYWASRR